MNSPTRDMRLNPAPGRKRPTYMETRISNLEEKASDLSQKFEIMQSKVHHLELAMRTRAKRLHTAERAPMSKMYRLVANSADPDQTTRYLLGKIRVKLHETFLACCFHLQCRHALEDIFTGSLTGSAIYSNLKVFFRFVLAEMKSHDVEVTDEKMIWHLLHSSGVLKVFGDSIVKLGLKPDDFCNTRRLLALVYVIQSDKQREIDAHAVEMSENALDSELKNKCYTRPSPRSDFNLMEQLLDSTESTKHTPESIETLRCSGSNRTGSTKQTTESIETLRCSSGSNRTEHTSVDLLDTPKSAGRKPVSRATKRDRKKSRRRSVDHSERLRKCRDWYRFYCNGDTTPNASQRVEDGRDSGPCIRMINNAGDILHAVKMDNSRRNKKCSANEINSARNALDAGKVNSGNKQSVHFANGGRDELNATRENAYGTPSTDDANECKTVLHVAKVTAGSRQSVGNTVSRSAILKRFIVDDVILHYVKGMIHPITDAVTNVPVTVKCIGDWDVGADMKYLVKRIVYIVLYTLNVCREGPLLTLAQ